MADSNDIGYLKYSGKLVEEGALDARKSAQALLGFDEAVRFFVRQQAPELAEANYEFPVRVVQGSWVISIPHDIIDLMKIAGGIVVTNYLAHAAGKMADNDFKDASLKEVFRNALSAIQWMMKIGKHLGTLGIKKFERPKFRNDNSEIGIQNPKGEYLYVPKFYYDLYIAAGSKLLAKISELIEEERTLIIGVVKDGKNVEEQISKQSRYIFTQEETESDDVVLPELEHGKKVRLEGEVTRGNEKTNNIGFQYRDHILTCEPESGSVVRFKPSLFLKARISGTVSRLDEFGRIAARRPKIIFKKIEPLEPDKTLSLFE